MPFTATVLNVMIASPSDAAKERRIAQRIIHDWNTVHTVERRMVLRPIRSDTHAWPETGAPPQAILNRQLVKDSDLLVAIFLTRIGTPTGVALSGTVEEIEEHVKANKPVMVYFSRAPVPQDSDQEQFRALREFKAWAREQGLIEEFKSQKEFKAKFSRQLQQTINAHFPHGSTVRDDRAELASNGTLTLPHDGGGGSFRFRSRDIELISDGIEWGCGPLGPFQAGEPIPAAAQVTGSYLGHGPARVGSQSWPEVWYAYGLTLTAADVPASTDVSQVSGRFVAEGTIELCPENPNTWEGPPLAEVGITGRGTVTIDLLKDMLDEIHGQLVTARRSVYNFDALHLERVSRRDRLAS
jgi:hypothetical protein